MLILKGMSANETRPHSSFVQRTPQLEKRRNELFDSLRSVIMNDQVVHAMSIVPRELFVGTETRMSAYDNRALPIGKGQTISQPLIVASMTAALKIRSTDRVLEVGTGTGYQAAILSTLAHQVVSVERIEALRDAAATRLTNLGYHNIDVELAVDRLGWPDRAPYDAILVAAAAPHLPHVLLDQMSLGGRLVLPIGGRDQQNLTLITRTPTGYNYENLGACQFVPLIGPDAWLDLSL